MVVDAAASAETLFEIPGGNSGSEGCSPIVDVSLMVVMRLLESDGDLESASLRRFLHGGPELVGILHAVFCIASGARNRLLREIENSCFCISIKRRFSNRFSSMTLATVSSDA